MAILKESVHNGQALLAFFALAPAPFPYEISDHILAVTGAAYVVLLSIPVGLLSAAILVVNNVRDIDSDKRADRQGRFTTRIDRRKLSDGKHRLSALVRFFGTKRTYRLGVKIKRCIDKTVPKSIKMTEGAGRACPASPFLAYVKGGTISSVEFRLNGELLEKVTVADWKKRYGVLIDPASLGAGENEVTALVKFISSSNTEPRELTRRVPPCEGTGGDGTRRPVERAVATRRTSVCIKSSR